MKRIFFTGGAGFLGRNLIPALQEDYEIFAPPREVLDLRDYEKLEQYLSENHFDIVIHAAIPDLLYSEEDKNGDMVKNSLLPFLHFHRLHHLFDRMFYFGSGAEYDKSQDICLAREENIGEAIPLDDYGFSKYVMNEICRRSENIYNLRIFGCFGPTDAPFKLLTSTIRSCMHKDSIELHQDCYFDFMYVENLIAVLRYFIEKKPEKHDYNVCSGKRVKISDICRLIQKEMECDIPIHIKNEGLNREYTGCNQRLIQEMPQWEFISLQEGIQKLIASEGETEQ